MSPAKNEAQRKLSCMALGMKRGKVPKSMSKQAAEMMASMSEQDLKKFCQSPIEKK